MRIVGRPGRISDIKLAEAVHGFMADHGLSLSQMALSLRIDKSTLSRSLQERSFSKRVRSRAYIVVGEPDGSESTEKSLLKALRLLEVAGILTGEAELAITQAIDQEAKER